MIVDPQIKTLDDQTLLIKLNEFVVEERNITAHIISFLGEVDRRKLYLKMGFGSLLEFCVKESDGQKEAA